MNFPVELDPDIVTPGPVGFFLTLCLAVTLILLGVNMSRRIRRLVHRAREDQAPQQDIRKAVDPDIKSEGNPDDKTSD